jgi:PhnB protein
MSEQVKAVPEGFHTITPAIVVKGAATAIDFYKQAFGAEEVSRMDGPDGIVMHAELRIGNSMLMMSDEFPQYGAAGPETIGGSPVTLCLYVDDCDAVFNRAVEAGATVKMPPADQFWGDRYAKLSDPFGHSWSISTHIKDLTHDEVMEAAAVAMSAAPCE